MWTQIRSFRWQTSSSAPLDMMVNFSAIFAIYTNGLEPITTKFLKMKFTSSQYVTQIIWKLAFYLNYRDCRTAVYHDGLEPLLQQVGLLHVLRERQSMWQLISCNCGAAQEHSKLKKLEAITNHCDYPLYNIFMEHSLSPSYNRDTENQSHP